MPIRSTAPRFTPLSIPSRALSPAALLGASFLFACGSGGSSSSGTTSTSTSSTTTSSTTTTTTTTTGTGGMGGMTGTGGMGTTTGTGGMGGMTGTGGMGTTTGTGGMGGMMGTGGMGGSLFCVPGTSLPCYEGPANTQGVGLCHDGQMTCNPDGQAFGPCVGQQLPVAETCATPGDDDCNGVANDQGVGCACVPGSQAPCYDGPMGTEGKGICKMGMHSCNAQGTGYEACVGQVLPMGENCNTPIDEDCDGLTPACPGSSVWAKVLGDTVDDEANAVTVDSSGNVIVGAYATLNPDLGCGPIPIGANYTGVLAKYTNDGTCLWTKAFVSQGVDHKSEVKTVATDAAGNIFISGIVFGGIDLGGGVLTSATPGESDIFLAKFGPNGNHIWSKKFGTAASQVPRRIRVDSQGNVLLAGMFANQVNFGPMAATNLTSAGNLDAFVAKFDTNGTHLWSKRFGDFSAQAAYGMAVDGGDNVILVGPVYSSINFGGQNLVSAGLGDVFVAKLSSAGAHVWSKRFGDAADQTTLAVATDAADNIALVGTFIGTLNFGGGVSLTTANPSDSFVVKLDSSGTPLWAKSGGGPDNQEFDSVAIDPQGNIVASGFLAGSGDWGTGSLVSAGVQDMLVVKYTPVGVPVWARSFGGPGTELGRGVAVDAMGAAFATGVCGPTNFGFGVQSGLGGEEYCLVKLSP
jgi:hypothetical protein